MAVHCRQERDRAELPTNTLGTFLTRMAFSFRLFFFRSGKLGEEALSFAECRGDLLRDANRRFGPAHHPGLQAESSIHLCRGPFVLLGW